MKNTLIALLCSWVTISNAQWNSDPSVNTPVSIANNYQIDLRMMEDGEGGFFIVWKDYRNGTPDIYAQRVDSLGNKLWAADGVPVCGNTSDQSTPGLISDGVGGIIVSWSDWRSGIERDIYAQRVSGSGQMLWTIDGKVVVNKVNREHNQRMVMDGQGGVIVVFEQKNSATYDWEIWAQRINANGDPVWAPGGQAVTGVFSEHLNERIQSDGQGGVYITFQDFRNGMDYDVYVQHLGPNGEYLWGSGVLACNAFGTQTNPKIDPDSNGGVIVSWTDMRNGVDYDIYAQRIDVNGNLLWGATGAPVAIAPGNQSAVDLLSNAVVDGVIFTWKDQRNMLDYDIYADKFSWEGASLWQVNGQLVCNNTGNQINPNITGDGIGGAAIVWQDQTFGNFDIRAQRIHPTGALQFGLSGYVISNAAGDQTSPKCASNEFGDGYIAWEDNRTGLADIYCTNLHWGGDFISVPEIESWSMQLYPNPTHWVLNWNALQTINKVEIYDLQGKCLFMECRPSVSGQLDVHHLAPGMYVLRLDNGVQRQQLTWIKD
jgi:hypothetical protein